MQPSETPMDVPSLRALRKCYKAMDGDLFKAPKENVVSEENRVKDEIIAALKEEGLENNTIVVFTSDHGFHLGEHKFWMKVSLHEESVRIPLVIKVPGRKPGTCSSFTEMLDLYPTLAELAGLEYPEHVQGKSLVPLLKDRDLSVRDMAFSVTQGGRTFLVRTDQYAYIQYDEDAGSGMELFDMHKDPQQFYNLALDPDYQEVVEEYQNKLKKKLEAVRTNDLGKTY